MPLVAVEKVPILRAGRLVPRRKIIEEMPFDDRRIDSATTIARSVPGDVVDKELDIENRHTAQPRFEVVEAEKGLVQELRSDLCLGSGYRTLGAAPE